MENLLDTVVEDSLVIKFSNFYERSFITEVTEPATGYCYDLNSAHILQTYFCNIRFRITSSYACFCQFISRIFSSKKEEMMEG